ncbi:MAG: YgjV family protein [Clostridia bacterium]|nr:YgjV family protein [Clostridia bacterium]
MNIYLEIFGYIGTALVIISMMMKSINRLRIFNISGSVISTIYSIIAGAWPIVVMNVSLIAINSYHLLKAYLDKENKQKGLEQ